VVSPEDGTKSHDSLKAAISIFILRLRGFGFCYCDL